MSTKKKRSKSGKKNGVGDRRKLSSTPVLKLINARDDAVSTRYLAQTLSRDDKPGRLELIAVLEQLVDEKQVVRLSKNKWCAPGTIKRVTGTIVGRADGDGFVKLDEGGEVVNLPKHSMQQVLHNDRVEVRITGKDRRGKHFGDVVTVLERKNTHITGRFFADGQIGFVVPLDQRFNQDFYIAPENRNGAAEGQVVNIQIIDQPTRDFQPTAKVLEVMGEYLDPGMEIEIAVRNFDLPHQWPTEVLDEIGKYESAGEPNDLQGREDITQLPLVTIDGEDARDFDDAVYCEKLDSGYRLVVAIADVSSYVTPGSALDAEAFERGNSVYFPRHVIPMLPEVLSNGLCSLKPEVNRNCFVCDITVKENGALEEYRFYPALMRSKARLTYTQVAGWLGVLDQATDSEQRAETPPAACQPSIKLLYALSMKLRQRRQQGGSIEFEVPESVVVFNDQRKIETVIARDRNNAHRLIEEMMLLANICAGDELEQHSDHGVFRVHETPDPLKVQELRQVLGLFGFQLSKSEVPESSAYAEVLASMAGHEQERFLQSLLLRSMKQARYAVDNEGHYALGFASYTHFTSPIRRYTDLHVHRELRAILRNKPNKSVFSAESIGVQTSMTERRAEDASRAVIQWLKTEYMTHRIGDTFTGAVSSVTDFGIFVELDELFIDGLVHVTNMGDDYWVFNANYRTLTGERGGRVYRLGTPVEIVVTRADLDTSRIDFDLVGAKQAKRAGKGKSGKAKGDRAKGGKGKGGKAKSGKAKSRKSKSNGKNKNRKPG
ncbi:MAG: ribonuclease R [Proteobacteria bacterium]|jgi:ribonuclease R|nr:ribonuclease R [Pseudomonadota bacterium]